MTAPTTSNENKPKPSNTERAFKALTRAQGITIPQLAGTLGKRMRDVKDIMHKLKREHSATHTLETWRTSEGERRYYLKEIPKLENSPPPSQS